MRKPSSVFFVFKESWGESLNTKPGPRGLETNQDALRLAALTCVSASDAAVGGRRSVQGSPLRARRDRLLLVHQLGRKVNKLHRHAANMK